MDMPESELDHLMPEEQVITEWVASMVAILSQVQVVRWKKGGVERMHGTIIPPLQPEELAQLIHN